jgi:hypothetical protein
VNALAYLARYPVVFFLDPARIVGNLRQACRDPRFKRASYAVLVTGRSATIDIEGVLSTAHRRPQPYRGNASALMRRQVGAKSLRV